MKNLKYIAKYLPFEGGMQRVVKENGVPVDFHQEVKLFLCSDLAKVGDKVIVARHKDDRDNGHYPVTMIIESEGDSRHAITYEKTTWNLIDSNGLKIEMPKNYCLRVVGEVSRKAIWVKEGDTLDESQISYCQSKRDALEAARLKWEKETGLGIGSWVKDSEDGYKARYQGQIYDYKLNGDDLQIFYASSAGGSYGYIPDIIPIAAPTGNGPYTGELRSYYTPVITIKCSQCETYH